MVRARNDNSCYKIALRGTLKWNFDDVSVRNAKYQQQNVLVIKQKAMFLLTIVWVESFQSIGEKREF